ncbi:hypothetical protein LTR56_027788 [Elasticomyces elasticus]|nr:hypothetical protein LTR56_027788 [Elasticomyces elasticus]
MSNYQQQKTVPKGTTTAIATTNREREVVPTELKKTFGRLTLFAFSLSFQASWEAVTANIGPNLRNGGPRGLFWGAVIVIPGVLCQAASFAEMSSMLPIAGAQYHWTWVLAPKQHRRLITWMQGWVTWFSWIATLAGAINLSANITTALASALHPDYTAQGWHTVLIMWAFLLALGLLNTYGFALVPWIESVSAVVHIALWLAVIVLLACFAPRHTPDFIFLGDTTSSGWTGGFVPFCIGASFTTWGFGAFDSTVHISEDTRNASHNVPEATFWGLTLNSAMTLVAIAMLCYGLGNANDVMMDIYPLLRVFKTAIGVGPACGIILV